jgi:hypothetical protein
LKWAAEYVRKHLRVFGCRSLIFLVKEVRRPGKVPVVEIHFFMSSLDPDKVSAKEFQDIILRHWEVENCLHCMKDVDFREDKHVIRSGWGAAWTMLTSMAVSLSRLLRKDERTLREVREKCRNKPAKTAKKLGWIQKK